MSRLTDLIAQAKAKDPQMGADLEREFRALSSRRSFGLNFERHRPENVELPQRPVRKGDKVRVLPPRGDTSKGDQRLWVVKQFEMQDGKKVAHLVERYAVEPETKQVDVTDLVVVAEFRDKIYPGLVSTGKVERGGDKPFHSVINGENYHALKALTFTHRGKIDAIYIDPPYNTGARDWKYNNDYVESEDLYRHSKWLAFMERRLKLAKELLNPNNSVLIATIDEKEYLRLGLLLEQTFPEANVQMISTVINSQGTPRKGAFSRVDEYIYIVQLGECTVSWTSDDMLTISDAGNRPAHKPQLWYPVLRSGTDPFRENAPNQFYPIFVNKEDLTVHSVGESLPLGTSRDSVAPPSDGVEVVWPILGNGKESRWQLGRDTFQEYVDKGYVKIGRMSNKGQRSVTYLRKGTIDRIKKGEICITGRASNGSVELEIVNLEKRSRAPKSVWNRVSHEAGEYGSKLIRKLLPDRKFPFPKSLYAVEDVLRFFLLEKKEATVLDFFSGSGTTLHAVLRLNRQDQGKRVCIAITNNEVASDEQRKLRSEAKRPGDKEWEQLGICEYITKPRILAAITGNTPDGSPINGSYKFNDEFPMSEGFEENAEFFTLTYETPVAITHNLAFSKVASLLWLRAGSEGKRIEELPPQGWDIAETYGVLADLDKSQEFCARATESKDMRIAYIVTNDDRRFQSVARNLPKNVEPVRLYEAYLNNFQFTNGE
ncbi:site-specific DNA-methyltransferase [Vibrio parahaemolyticus]|nr:site-specific DNA-methyltransferase [Vibrio alginolyticus]EIV8639152.1 site-specific DNA-methyltransferase [Vibrio parahaemolyticus]EJB0232275.1 site-specific DNA-methyltransferase [Vibrio vulnificus]